jgi:hypothetical protein
MLKKTWVPIETITKRWKMKGKSFFPRFLSFFVCNRKST